MSNDYHIPAKPMSARKRRQMLDDIGSPRRQSLWKLLYEGCNVRECPSPVPYGIALHWKNKLSQAGSHEKELFEIRPA